MTEKSKRLGERGEDAAAAYLERVGHDDRRAQLALPGRRDRHRRSRRRDARACARSRRGKTAAKGTPEDAVTPAKQRRYRQACRGVPAACRARATSRCASTSITLLVIAEDRALLRHHRAAFVAGVRLSVAAVHGPHGDARRRRGAAGRRRGRRRARAADFAIVGLPDLAVQEARERVRSALQAAGFDLPNARIVVNLAPGPLRKHGTGFDLPIALGLLVATRQLPSSARCRTCVAVGELSLDGSVRPVPGCSRTRWPRVADGAAAARTRRSRGAAARSTGLDYRPLDHLAALRQGLPGTRVATRTPKPSRRTRRLRLRRGRRAGARDARAA